MTAPTQWLVEIGTDYNASTVIPMVMNQTANPPEVSDLRLFQAGDQISFQVTDLTDYQRGQPALQIGQQTVAGCALTFLPLSPLPGNVACLLDSETPPNQYYGLTLYPTGSVPSLFYPGLMSITLATIPPGDVGTFTFNQPNPDGVGGRFSVTIATWVTNNGVLGSQDPEIFVGGGNVPPP